MELQELYAARFPKEHLQRKQEIWKVLCSDFFQKFVDENETVVDIGAGYCEFINNIKAQKKLAVDLNPATRGFKDNDVEFIQASCFDLTGVREKSVGHFFISNFLEHLESSQQVIDLLTYLAGYLKPNGTILILQPNIKLVGGAYWDYIDHKVPLTESSLQEAAELANLKVDRCIDRFLPYTLKSKLPTHPLFVKLYLMFPLAWYFMGKQTFMILRK